MGFFCNTIARCFMCIFNIVFLICGAGMVLFGLIGIVGKHSMTSLFHGTNPEYGVVADVTRVPNLLMSTSVFMIVLGAFVMAFALIGFIGASIMLNILLLVYAILVGVVLIAEVALIVFAILLPVKYQHKSEDLLYDSLKEQYKHSVSIDKIMDPSTGRVVEANADKISWLLLETKFSCCGAHNYTDYQTIDWNRTLSLQNRTLQTVVPFSCCKNPTEVGVNMTNCLQGQEDEINTEGCYKAVTKLVWGFGILAIIIAVISIAVEILLLWASLHLFNSS